MIKYQILSYKGSKVCLFENKFTSEELLNEFSNKELYFSILDKLNFEHRKKEFLGLRLALKHCCGGEEKLINHTPDGKPMLSDNSCKISFSHCKDWIAVMVHPVYDVGIDIEKPTDKLWNVATRFLGKEEQEELQKVNHLDYLRVAWSVKEALYKIIGENAYNFAKQLKVLPFALQEEGTLDVLYTETGKKFTVNYLLTNDYTLAYCIDNE